MDDDFKFMYKNTMIADVVSRGPGYYLHSPPGAQLLLCSFCRMEKWEHDDLTEPYWRWYWNDRSGAVVGVDGKTIALDPGCVVLIPQNTAFSTHTDRLVGHLYMHFVLGLSRIAPTDRVFVQHPPQNELKQIRRLVRMMQPGTGAQDLAVSFAAQALVAAALARVPDGYWAGSTVDTQIERVLRTLHERVPETLSNQMLAREANMGVSTLLRRFRQVTGTSPHQYLVRLRIERAREMLRSTDATLDKIAAQTGFCDRFHLSRVFKQHTYMGPAAFRRRHQQR